MGQLIDDLLQLSRVSRQRTRAHPVDVSALAQSVARRLGDANPGRRIEFVIAPDLVADADARLLEIALTNLFDNACKFTAARDARAHRIRAQDSAGSGNAGAGSGLLRAR